MDSKFFSSLDSVSWYDGLSDFQHRFQTEPVFLYGPINKLYVHPGND